METAHKLVGFSYASLMPHPAQAKRLDILQCGSPESKAIVSKQVVEKDKFSNGISFTIRALLSC